MKKKNGTICKLPRSLHTTSQNQESLSTKHTHTQTDWKQNGRHQRPHPYDGVRTKFKRRINWTTTQGSQPRRIIKKKTSPVCFETLHWHAKSWMKKWIVKLLNSAYICECVHLCTYIAHARARVPTWINLNCVTHTANFRNTASVTNGEL